MIKPYYHKIQYYETDKMQITSHTNYIRFMEEARTDFLEQIGWAYNQFEAHHIISPVTKVFAKYLRTTTYPDVIQINTSIKNFNRHKLVLQYFMTVNHKLVCKATSEHCFLNHDNKIINLKKQVPNFYHQLNELLNQKLDND